jgi:mono/diheme cytochrome c family protein
MVTLTLTAFGSVAQAKSINDGIYTLAQAGAGKQIYHQACAVCHGSDLAGGEGGAALDVKTRTTMPVVNPNGLSKKAYDQVLSFSLLSN